MSPATPTTDGKNDAERQFGGLVYMIALTAVCTVLRSLLETLGGVEVWAVYTWIAWATLAILLIMVAAKAPSRKRLTPWYRDVTLVVLGISILTHFAWLAAVVWSAFY